MNESCPTHLPVIICIGHVEYQRMLQSIHGLGIRSTTSWNTEKSYTEFN